MFLRLPIFCVSLIALSVIMASSVAAQRLIAAVSTLDVSIDSNFSGETLTLFGNVEPGTGNQDSDVSGPFDVVVTVHGPSATHTVREKARQLGIWLNSKGTEFSSAPSFYQILSSRRLSSIAERDVLETLGIEFEAMVRRGMGLPPSRDGASPDSINGIEFNEVHFEQLKRLLADADLYGEQEHSVVFMSPTFYRAQISLPTNVPNGSFLAKTYLFHDGELVDQRAIRFLVHTTGIERWLERSAADWPFLYGLAAVLLALFTGWFASIVFRR